MLNFSHITHHCRAKSGRFNSPFNFPPSCISALRMEECSASGLSDTNSLSSVWLTADGSSACQLPNLTFCAQKFQLSQSYEFPPTVSSSSFVWSDYATLHGIFLLPTFWGATNFSEHITWPLILLSISGFPLIAPEGGVQPGIFYIWSRKPGSKVDIFCRILFCMAIFLASLTKYSYFCLSTSHRSAKKTTSKFDIIKKNTISTTLNCRNFFGHFAYTHDDKSKTPLSTTRRTLQFSF